MDVLQVVPSFDRGFGGPATSSRSVSQALVNIGLDIEVLGPGQPDPRWPHAVGHRSRRLPLLPASVGTYSWPVLLSEFRAIRHVGVGAVHVHLNRGLVGLPSAALALAMGRPLVVQTHGMCTPWRGAKALLDRVLTAPILSRADLVLVLSTQEAEDLGGYTSPERIEVLPNALAEEPVGRREQPAEPTFLFCARLHPRKGLDVFVHAAAAIAHRLPTARFLVAGPDEGALEEAQRQASKQGVEVCWLGLQPEAEIRRLMAEATALLHPAEDEPFGMSMVEALGRGLPVITAASARLAPLLAAADAALLVQGASSQAYATAAVALHEDRARWTQLSDGGRRLHQAEFALPVLERRLRQLYDRVLPGQRAA